MSPTLIALITPFMALVAGVYAAVGLGGGTGYLAVMTLVGLPTESLASTALLLNLLVTGAAVARSALRRAPPPRRSAHPSESAPAAGCVAADPAEAPAGFPVRWFVFWPFLWCAVPAAFVGSLLSSPSSFFLIVLAASLLAAGLFTLSTARRRVSLLILPSRRHHWLVAACGGGAIGLVAGFVGIGGGVFLGPLLLGLRWARVREVTAFGSVFVLVLSAVGLLGHGLGGGIELGIVIPFGIAALVGGFAGMWVAERRLSPCILQRTLAIVVLLAGAKAALDALGW